MRWKIILFNGGIVLILSLVTFFLLRTSLSGAVADPKSQKAELVRAMQAAEARLTLDSLQAERWLARQAATEQVVDVFLAGTAAARADAATAQANRLRDLAVGSPEFAKMPPALVLFVSAEGLGMGRNGSELMRGDKVVDAYPGLAASLLSGNTGSELWVNEKRQEQLMTSYAPVEDDAGKVVGVLVLGTPLNDERLSTTSEASSGDSIALVFAGKTIAVGGARLQGFSSEAVKAAVSKAGAGTLNLAQGSEGGFLFGAAPMGAFTGAVLVGSAPVSLVASVDALLWPVFAVGLLGLFLVVTGGFVLGNYISRPIAEIEEGLLLIINGQQDLRFDLEHDELGGLTSRINGLLNAILGVPEEESSSR